MVSVQQTWWKIIGVELISDSRHTVQGCIQDLGQVGVGGKLSFLKTGGGEKQYGSV